MRSIPYEKLTGIFDTLDDMGFVVVTVVLERPVSSG